MTRDRARLLAFTLASVAALASANAADSGPAPEPATGGYKDVPVYPTWAGFYIGAHIGAAWATDHVQDVDGLNRLPLPPPGASFDVNQTSAIGGGQAGYNWQGLLGYSALVVGVETDFGGVGLTERRFDPNFIGGTFSGLDSGFYGDVTGRIGYSFGSALAYGKGGFAYFAGDAFVDNHLGGFGGGRARTADTFTGWTAGGGLEYLVRQGWSVKLEYLHFDFGEQDAVLHTPLHGNFRYSNELTADTLTVGFSYHFTPAYEPLK